MATSLRGRLTLAVALAPALGLVGASPALAVTPTPVNFAPPELQGPAQAQDGLAYTTKAGIWDGPPGGTISRQWMRCNAAGGGCQDIPDATGSSYTLGAADVGGRVRVRETGTCAVTSPLCQPVSSYSGVSPPVLSDPHNEALPHISGLARAGEVLSASVGFWRSPASLGFGYQWLRCDRAGGACSEIAGATRPDYRLTTALTGARVRVLVRAGNARPRSATAMSAPTPAVAPPPPNRIPAKLRRGHGRGARLLFPFPRIIVAGVISGSSAQLTEFTVRGPRRALVRVRCIGRRCPFRSRRLVTRTTRVRLRSLERVWPAGPVLEVAVTRRGFIGKFSRFRFRAGNVPRRRDLCLSPGARKPRRCPRS